MLNIERDFEVYKAGMVEKDEYRMYSADELISLGLVKKWTDEFLKRSNYESEIEDLFKLRCYNLTVDDIQGLSISSEHLTAGQFIFLAQREIVVQYLNLELSKHIKEQKGLSV